MRRVIISQAFMTGNKEVLSYEASPHLGEEENIMLGAQKFQLEHCAFSSVNWYMHDTLRIYPYRIEYGKKGNVKFAGQKTYDGCNPIIYEVTLSQ